MESEKRKRVVKVNSSTNQIIETFTSLAEAGRDNNDNLSYAQICRKCLGNSKNDSDIIWCYENDIINNTIPTYKLTNTNIKKLSNFTEIEFNLMYNEYKSGSKSMREISKENNITFSTLNKYLIERDKPKNIIYENSTFAVRCKKTGIAFADYKNTSGCITKHIQNFYPDVEIPTKYLRKQIELKTGKYWYYDYFDFLTC